MCTRILQSVPEIAMYDKYQLELLDSSSGRAKDAKQVFHEQELKVLIRDYVEFTREIEPEDFKSMEALRWLQKQNDFSTTMGYYVELARKFLIEGRLKAARFLLREQLSNNMSARDKQVLEDKINESKLTLSPE